MSRRWRRSGFFSGALAGVIVMAIIAAAALAAVVLFAQPVPCHSPVFEVAA